MNLKMCLLIPVFRHVSQIKISIKKLEKHSIDIFLIDDGNNSTDKESLLSLATKNIHIISHKENRGKGAAIKTGINEAFKMGFTHAIQIDADGQHNIDDISRFIKEAQNFPNSLILGTPVFDETAPFCRVYGRKITTAIVALETLNIKIKDALFGFRVYPIELTKKVIEENNTANRMGFDPEIVVRLSWEGVDIQTIKTKVIYPEDGFSNFKYFSDNIEFIILHTKLITIGLLKKLKYLLTKKLFLKNKNYTEIWFKKAEHGSIFGLKLVLFLYKIGGRPLLKALLYPVILYFFLRDKVARKSSFEFLSNIHSFDPNTHPKANDKLVLKHLHRFGLKIISSIQAWLGHIPPDSIDWHGHEYIYKLLDEGKGGIILSAHFGCMEVCRAVHRNREGLKIVPLMYLKNAKIFRNFLNKLNPLSNEEIIEVDNIHPGVALSLKEKINKGQFISILADRSIANSKDKTITIKFLNNEAHVPEGPFALAYSLDCPLISFFSFFDQKIGRYQVYVKKIEVERGQTKLEKINIIKKISQSFFSELEIYCLREPFEWFNFFPFWKNNNLKTTLNK